MVSRGFVPLGREDAAGGDGQASHTALISRRSPETRAGPGIKRGSFSLHSMALKYLLTTPAQPRAVLLQTLLNRAVVAQLLSAKSLCVSRTGLLLLRGAHMALG
jgi:hypothetical protein